MTFSFRTMYGRKWTSCDEPRAMSQLKQGGAVIRVMEGGRSAEVRMAGGFDGIRYRVDYSQGGASTPDPDEALKVAIAAVEQADGAQLTESDGGA